MSNAIHILKQSIASLLNDKTILEEDISEAEKTLLNKAQVLYNINSKIEELIIAIEKLEGPNVKSKNKKA
jgi:hypothetical protein